MVDDNLKSALWTSEKQLALKQRAHYEIWCLFVLTSLYCPFRDTNIAGLLEAAYLLYSVWNPSQKSHKI